MDEYEELNDACDDLDRLETEKKRAEQAGDSGKAEALEDSIERLHYRIAELEVAIAESY